MRKKRGTGVGLRQDGLDRRGDCHALMAVPAGVLRVHVPLDPHLRRLVVISLADLFPDPLPHPARPVVLAPLLLRGQVVHDLLAGQMGGDRLAAAGVRARFAFMGCHGRSTGLIGRFRCLDRGEHLGLVEQHLLLIRRDIGLGEPLGGAAEELALQPPHFLLEQSLALDRLAKFPLQLLVGFPELSEGLFGDLQPRRKFGVFIENR